MRKLLVLGVAASLLLAACGGDDSATSNQGAVKLPGTVNDKGTKTASGASFKMEADNFFFNPTFVDAKPGTKLTVTIANVGNVAHTFTIDSANVDKEIPPGKSASVDVMVPSSGSLNFYCRFHRGSGMQGAIVAK
jgi:plastocyanin